MNCFQKLLSSGRRTTFNLSVEKIDELWIAFKNYYLRDEEQPMYWSHTARSCCELLSKIIIFGTKNNIIFTWTNCLIVVNCFQKLLSSGRRTTRLHFPNLRKMLWIAFKNYYLRDEEQQMDQPTKTDLGCELLSKIIIFGTKNNNPTFNNRTIAVVNCFQKLLSSGRRTTISCNSARVR